jgi:hypothetical protein
MADLRELLDGAVDPPALDLDVLGRRLTRRRRRRSVARAAAIVLVVGATAGVGALALRSGADHGDDIEMPPAGRIDDSTVVVGGPDGVPPCAEPDGAEDGASVEHPERAPLQAYESFDGAVRWAICGADTALGSDLFNLRSDDDGATWSVTDTSLDHTPSHAGDEVDVVLVNASYGTIRLVGEVDGTDESYVTTDGGLHWDAVG